MLAAKTGPIQFSNIDVEPDTTSEFAQYLKEFETQEKTKQLLLQKQRREVEEWQRLFNESLDTQRDHRIGGDTDGGGGDDDDDDATYLFRHWDLYYDSNVPEAFQFEQSLKKQYKDSVYKRDRLISTQEYYQQPTWKREKQTGDQMIEALFKCLAGIDQTKFRRSPSQMEMHVLMTQACLRQIYGTEYLSKLPELLQRFEVATFHSLVSIFATRRFGKTFALAQFIAAFMWTQQRSVINVFSLSRRASISMVNKILMMLYLLVPKGSKLQINRHNQEELIIVNPAGIASTVYSYPCSEIRFMFFFGCMYVCIFNRE